MSRRTSAILLTALALSALPACGLLNAGPGPRDAGTEEDTGVDPMKDGGTPGDAGDTGEPPACEEGKADRCDSGEMCLGGECLPRCTFGPVNSDGDPRVTPNMGNAFPTCSADSVCIPPAYQDTNYFGACVPEIQAQEMRADAACDDVETPRAGVYCTQLLQDSDATCEDDRCIIPCSQDDECDFDSLCALDDDGDGACLPIDCGDTPDPDLTCVQRFNQTDEIHPTSQDEAAFTRDEAYCLSGQCYIRIDGEARDACADTSACGDEQVCVNQTYCMDTCESDGDCGELVCAYTLQVDEDVSTEDDEDVSPFVCVDYETLNFGQLADPIAFCELFRDTETGPASWDRETGDCVYGSRSFSGSVRYAFIQDTTFECDTAVQDGDLPGVEDPGADISFIGLSDTDDPFTTSAFSDVYAIGRVVKIHRDGTSDNDLPGYGHLDGLLLEDEDRFTATTGCPSSAPAPNNTISLGCGGGVFVEFSRSDDPQQVVNLDPETGNKYIVVSEYDSTCGTSGIDAINVSVFEEYRVYSCDSGVALEALDPNDCTNELSDPTTFMPEGQGPKVFGF